MKNSEAKLKHIQISDYRAVMSGPGRRNYLQKFIYNECLCLNRFPCGFLRAATRLLLGLSGVPQPKWICWDSLWLQVQNYYYYYWC